MKTLNTIIISGLLAVSINATVAAADLSQQTAEMNRVLQSQIDEKINLIDKQISTTLQAKATARSQATLGNTSAALDNTADQQVTASRS